MNTLAVNSKPKGESKSLNIKNTTINNPRRLPSIRKDSQPGRIIRPHHFKLQNGKTKQTRNRKVLLKPQRKTILQLTSRTPLFRSSTSHRSIIRKFHPQSQRSSQRHQIQIRNRLNQVSRHLQLILFNCRQRMLVFLFRQILNPKPCLFQ